MASTNELFDFSVTSNWGSDVDLEIDAEVLLYVLTPKQSIPYYRDMGTNLVREETRPLNVFRAISIGNQIVETVQTYNDDHEISDEERRVSIPFEEIEINDEEDRVGNYRVTAKYQALRNIQEARQVKT